MINAIFTGIFRGKYDKEVRFYFSIIFEKIIAYKLKKHAQKKGKVL